MSGVGRAFRVPGKIYVGSGDILCPHFIKTAVDEILAGRIDEISFMHINVPLKVFAAIFTPPYEQDMQLAANGFPPTCALKTVTLYNVHLVPDHVSLFKFPRSVTTLDVSMNTLLGDYLWTYLTTTPVVNVCARYCELGDWPEYVTNFEHLETLHLGHNSIFHIPETAWTGPISKLKVLHLGGNFAHEMHIEAALALPPCVHITGFSQVPELQRLFCKYAHDTSTTYAQLHRIVSMLALGETRWGLFIHMPSTIRQLVPRGQTYNICHAIALCQQHNDIQLLEVIYRHFAQWHMSKLRIWTPWTTMAFPYPERAKIRCAFTSGNIQHRRKTLANLPLELWMHIISFMLHSRAV